MLSNARHSLIAASVLGTAALAAAFPACAQSTDQKMRTAFSACQKKTIWRPDLDLTPCLWTFAPVRY